MQRRREAEMQRGEERSDQDPDLAERIREREELRLRLIQLKIIVQTRQSFRSIFHVVLMMNLFQRDKRFKDTERLRSKEAKRRIKV